MAKVSAQALGPGAARQSLAGHNGHGQQVDEGVAEKGFVGGQQVGFGDRRFHGGQAELGGGLQGLAAQDAGQDQFAGRGPQQAAPDWRSATSGSW